MRFLLCLYSSDKKDAVCVIERKKGLHKANPDIPCAVGTGADNRSRTYTVSRWNLNPVRLPVPPYPHMNVATLFLATIRLYHFFFQLSIGFLIFFLFFYFFYFCVFAFFAKIPLDKFVKV